MWTATAAKTHYIHTEFLINTIVDWSQLDKKAVLLEGNRAMQVFFSVEVRQQHSLQV